MNLRDNLIRSLAARPAWVALADAVQAVNDAVVEPVLDRLKARPRLFDMHPDDVKVLFDELGAVFEVGDPSVEDRPLLLQQRQDEIRQKSTTYPLQKTLDREYENIRVRWRPLFAPVDIATHPYGTLLSPEPDIGIYDIAGDQWFQTSRGVVEINITDVYRMYPGLSFEGALPQFEAAINRLIRPLVPVKVVFDGFFYVLRIEVTDLLSEISRISAEILVNYSAFSRIPKYRIGVQRIGSVRLDVPSDESRRYLHASTDIVVSMKSLVLSKPVRFDAHRIGQYRLGAHLMPPDTRIVSITRTIDE